jgi:L-aspartate oxidase
MSKLIKTDVLIIGSGFAGLLAAVKLIESGASVVLVCKAHLPESNTNYAQGGIAAATDKGSSAAIKSHLEDTLNAGAGLVDEKAAQEIIAGGWQLIEI